MADLGAGRGGPSTVWAPGQLPGPIEPVFLAEVDVSEGDRGQELGDSLERLSAAVATPTTSIPSCWSRARRRLQ
jgi:hypothetical protein